MVRVLYCYWTNTRVTWTHFSFWLVELATCLRKPTSILFTSKLAFSTCEAILIGTCNQYTYKIGWVVDHLALIINKFSAHKRSSYHGFKQIIKTKHLCHYLSKRVYFSRLCRQPQQAQLTQKNHVKCWFICSLWGPFTDTAIAMGGCRRDGIGNPQ